MIENFTLRITAEMVDECDVEGAAEVAMDSCPNPDALVTWGALDAEHARMQVKVDRSIQDVEEYLIERCGEVDPRAISGLKAMAETATEERKHLRDLVEAGRRRDADQTRQITSLKGQLEDLRTLVESFVKRPLSNPLAG